ncbi:hypothetical protein [Streptomyces prasinus]
MRVRQCFDQLTQTIGLVQQVGEYASRALPHGSYAELETEVAVYALKATSENFAYPTVRRNSISIYFVALVAQQPYGISKRGKQGPCGALHG